MLLLCHILTKSSVWPPLESGNPVELAINNHKTQSSLIPMLSFCACFSFLLPEWFAMQWLYTAFSSSSSSSPATSSTADDNYINNRTSVAGSHHRRRMTENDVVHTPSRSKSTSHTLPLPDLSALFKSESAGEQKSNYILPSPVNRRSDDKRGISDGNRRDSKRPPG